MEIQRAGTESGTGKTRKWKWRL